MENTVSVTVTIIRILLDGSCSIPLAIEVFHYKSEEGAKANLVHARRVHSPFKIESNTDEIYKSDA